MKPSTILLTIALSSVSAAYASEKVECISDTTTQQGATLTTQGAISFDFEKNGNASRISNVNGKVSVGYDDVLNEDDAYNGFFKIDSLLANPNYKPLKYKGYAQFKDFDAYETRGGEHGMWGNFLVELSDSMSFKAKYIFQAGDHMGGTMHFNCSVK